MEKKVKHGACFVLHEELFNDMLSKYLGLESIQVWHATTAHQMRGIEISITTTDERFPKISEGSSFPILTPIVEIVRVTEYPLRYEAKFKGFSEITP